MKFFALIFFAVALFPATDNRATANVFQQQGIFIFVLCEPATPYTFAGTVKVKSAMWQGVAPEMLRLSIEKTKKDFPAANGLIFHSLDMNNADAVIFNP